METENKLVQFRLVIGSLGGANSWINWGGINDRAEAVGFAETAVPDPDGEDVCGFGTHLTCRPFLWQNGHMSALPMLGGNNGQGGMESLGGSPSQTSWSDSRKCDQKLKRSENCANRRSSSFPPKASDPRPPFSSTTEIPVVVGPL
jgi:hypothetical protein